MRLVAGHSVAGVTLKYATVLSRPRSVRRQSSLAEILMNYLPYVFAIGTALCWGMYGATLGNARAADPDASPFKPYVGIGVAYLVIAIIGGLIVVAAIGKDNWNFFDGVTKWGFFAGSLGAIGALCLTAAMFNKGVPHTVMPVVFGGAVTVAALWGVFSPMVKDAMKSPEVRAEEAAHAEAEGHKAPSTSPWLWVGIVGMGISAVIIAANTPHGHPKKKKPAADTPTEKVDGEATDPN